jgi:hypothetical protein
MRTVPRRTRNSVGREHAELAEGRFYDLAKPSAGGATPSVVS